MSSTHYGILIHAIFSTRFRQRLIHQDWEAQLWSYMGGIVKAHKGVLLSAGGVDDHVHLLLGLHPAYAIADTVKLIKANSSRWVNESRKIQTKFQWQRGYGAFSVSRSMAGAVKRYIAIQREHHRTVSYREEYLEFLGRHMIDFDPKFVFEDEFHG